MPEPQETAAATPAAAPKTPESIGQAMERLGWEKDVAHADNPDSLGARARAARSEPAAEPKTEPAETDPEQEDTKPDLPKPSAPAAPAALDDKRKQLETLVKELGLELQDGKVTVAERAALREERRQARAQLEKLEQEAKTRTDAMIKSLEEREGSLKPRIGKLEAWERAVEEDDHEALAKLMGHESYDKWQEHIIGVKSDPNYKTLRALKDRVEREAKEREEREAKAAQEAEEQAKRAEQTERQRKQQEIDSNYCRDLSKQMAESGNPLLKAFSDDPQFVGAVFRIQKEHWDGEKTIPIEEAIKTPARGAKLALDAELKRIYDKLVPIFSTPASSDGATVAAVKAGVGKPAPAAPAPAKKVARTPEPTKPPAAAAKKQTDNEWKESARRRLEEAARQDAVGKRRAV